MRESITKDTRIKDLTDEAIELQRKLDEVIEEVYELDELAGESLTELLNERYY